MKIAIKLMEKLKSFTEINKYIKGLNKKHYSGAKDKTKSKGTSLNDKHPIWAYLRFNNF